jgi:signal recognition particle subunit SRP19
MVENVIWPEYLDSERSRSEGRRVPLDVAVPGPSLEEIAQAVGQVGYDAVVEREVSYPRTPHEESGRVIVRDADDSSKNDIIQAVAAYVSAMRE